MDRYPGFAHLHHHLAAPNYWYYSVYAKNAPTGLADRAHLIQKKFVSAPTSLNSYTYTKKENNKDTT